MIKKNDLSLVSFFEKLKCTLLVATFFVVVIIASKFFDKDTKSLEIRS